MPDGEPAVLETFRATLEADRREHVRPWMVEWAYQENRRRGGERYGEGLPREFLTYEGPRALLEWMRWAAADEKPDYFDDDRIEPLVERSVATDRAVLERHGLEADAALLRAVGRYNAQDYLFQTLYPVPARQRVSRILDFGAGYGRQANLWTRLRSDVSYVAVDAVPLSYCAQADYYRGLDVPFRDYLDGPRDFAIDETPGIRHLPTWRFDLLPDDWFDMVVCVQVLQELSARLVEEVLPRFHAALRPGGALYLRDHVTAWQPVHGLDVDERLEQLGFVQEFRPHVVDRRDVHGIPRIWRKPDPSVVASLAPPPTSPLRRLARRANRATGGLLGRAARGLRRSPGRRPSI